MDFVELFQRGLKWNHDAKMNEVSVEKMKFEKVRKSLVQSGSDDTSQAVLNRCLIDDGVV